MLSPAPDPIGDPFPPPSSLPFIAVRPGPLPAAGEQPSGRQRLSPAGCRLTEFGELLPLVSDPAVTDVFANGAGRIWIDRGAGLELRADISLDEADLHRLAVRLISAGGRHVDEANPCVDVRLHDGIRVHAVLAPISPGGTLLSIRLPRLERLTIPDLERTGMFDLVDSATILRLVADRQNILITGAAGSGKTTLLSALLGTVDAGERIVAIEDVAELRVRHPHFICLEARQANLEGAGGIGLERLVREALRMRPDRLVIGECRGGELRELLTALNTGHDGGAGTLHANSLADVPARLEALGALAGMTTVAVARQTISAIGAVLHLVRKNGVPQLAQVGRFAIDRSERLRMIESAPGSLSSTGNAR
ncbi:MAG: TadA family conjugal transfer-associated ATPase [Microbacteriaceae bacterium]